jgi:hypothetical protein
MMRKTKPPYTLTVVKERGPMTTNEAKVIAARLDELMVQVMRLARAVEKLGAEAVLDDVRPRADGDRPQALRGVR